mgnify:CR=1 FL=1
MAHHVAYRRVLSGDAWSALCFGTYFSHYRHIIISLRLCVGHPSPGREDFCDRLRSPAGPGRVIVRHPLAYGRHEVVGRGTLSNTVQPLASYHHHSGWSQMTIASRPVRPLCIMLIAIAVLTCCRHAGAGPVDTPAVPLHIGGGVDDPGARRVTDQVHVSPVLRKSHDPSPEPWPGHVAACLHGARRP